MGCSIKDVRFTIRRHDAEETVLYPRLLRDDAAMPKIAIAIEYFESLLGHERRELDPELLVSFFGDHKMARCMVAALSRTYRFRPRRLDEVLGKMAVRRLARLGITAPKQLRLALFDTVNEQYAGFAPIQRQDEIYCEVAARLGLQPSELRHVLFLDQVENAVLQRYGERARPEDIAAQFNFAVLEVLLRHAASIELTFRRPTAPLTGTIQGIASAQGLEVVADGDRTITLHGHQDALGSWSRHGRKLTRVVLELLERGRADVLAGRAVLPLANRQTVLYLKPDLLPFISRPAVQDPDWQNDTSRRTAILTGVITAVHRAPDGRTIRRFPEAQARHEGVVLPDLLLQSPVGNVLLCAVRSVDHARRLAAVAGHNGVGEPLLFVGTPEALQPLTAAGAACCPTPEFGQWCQDSAAAAIGGTAKAQHVRTIVPAPGAREVALLERSYAHGAPAPVMLTDRNTETVLAKVTTTRR